MSGESTYTLDAARDQLAKLFGDKGESPVVERKKPTFIIDLPSAEIDNKCGMAFWNHRIEGGRGLMLKTEVLPHKMVAETHNDLHTLTEMTDITPMALQEAIDEILAHLTIEDKMNIPKMEFLYRRLGWFAAYGLFMEPDIRANFKDIPIEPELVLDRDPLWVVTYPDRLLQSLHNPDTIVYREFELQPAGLQSKQWLQSWQYKMRLHAGMAAAEQALDNVKIGFGQIVGLYEGFRSSMASDHRLIHPYVWGYYNSHKEEWSMSSVSGNDSNDWVSSPVWEFKGGVVAWVRMCGKTVAENQFRASPYINLDRKLLDDWCASRVARERQVNLLTDAAMKNPGLKNLHFEKRTHNCVPHGGKECPFLKMCWEPEVNKMPLKSGFYIQNQFTIGGAHHSGRED
jgi:hypothetical protein